MFPELNLASFLRIATLITAIITVSIALSSGEISARQDSPFLEYEMIGAELLLHTRDRLPSMNRMEAVSVDMLRQMVLERNLSVKITGMDERRASLERIRRDAVFDTIINFTLNYTKKDSYSRSATIGRERRITADPDQEDPTQDDNPMCVYVNGVLINPVQCDAQYAYSVEEEYASYGLHDKHSPDVATGNLSLSRAFPWGQSVQFGLQSSWSFNKYPSLGKYSHLYTYDVGVEGYPYGNNPWTSSVYLNLNSPLPYCKNFGEEGNYNTVLRRVSDLEAMGKQFDLEAEASDKLALALRYWWDLAGGLSRLVVTVKARKNLEALARRTERLVAQGERTTYAMAQVGTELQLWRNAEEKAWSDYRLISNQLAELLNMNQRVLFFPLGFGEVSDIPAPTSQDIGKELDQALNSRPDLQVARINLKSTTALQTFHQRDLLPDISIFFSSSLSQDSTYWGYGSWADSVKNILKPDSSSFYLGFVYNFPVGERAAESAYTQSRLEREKSRLKYNSKKLDIVQEINKASTDSKATARNMNDARKSLHLKKQTYAKARELKDEDGSISEFELLRKFTEFTSTELQLIVSTVSHQKAGIDLKWATGKLLPAEWTASSTRDMLDETEDATQEEQP